ncbi:TIGR04053 family radical SAM/SPASM domain-containing protein [Kiritimatiellaeota bacterium B1221]|nr:TIGR04053 family radical SAM/SPASM domain-containing protein [Kiritimatiellaeota bacterium B1221]
MSGKKGFDVDFKQAPLLVIWEVTRACTLACQHCRASAIDYRHPDELNLEEGKILLDEIKAMGTPIVVFTGGDPLQRTDLEELIRYGKSIGLRIGTIPAGTPRLDKTRMRSLKESGVDQVAFSIDAPNAADHDSFRQVPGSYDLTLQGARWAQELNIPLQINTVFHQGNQHQIDELCDLVKSLEVVFWEVFFLVPTGRGTQLSSCTAEEMEVIFGKLYALSKKVPFVIKVTEAQHYRRHIRQQERKVGPPSSVTHRNPYEVQAKTAHPHAIGRSSKVVNAGNGFCFIDHTGNICPSGFLSEERGNVRTHSLAHIYREDEFFVNLRNPKLLKGKCGRCEFKTSCGGSRSRAWAVTGDAWAEEPFCVLER